MLEMTWLLSDGNLDLWQRRSESFQSGVGCPTIKIARITVGGTEISR